MRASHAACGMMASGAASLGLAGVRVLIFSKVCTMCTLSRLVAPGGAGAPGAGPRGVVVAPGGAAAARVSG